MARRDMELEIRTADELFDGQFAAKWADRRAVGLLGWEVFRHILGRFIDQGGPVGAETIALAFPEPREAVTRMLAVLDEKDLILVREGRVELAYPFSAFPTAFSVILPGGRERYAVCALDALGIPVLLDERVTIRSRCHHCREPLGFSVAPEGPARDADGLMLWVGDRGDLHQKACTSL